MRRCWMVLVTVLSSAAAAAEAPGLEAGAERWASETRSPRPYAPSTDLLWLMCPEPDQALTAAARRVANGAVVVDDVASALRVAGSPHVSARTLLLESATLSPAVIRARVRTWLDATPVVGRRRCGFASATAHGRTRFAAVSLDALADLAPVPVRVRPGTWLDVDARVHGAATSAKVVVQGPDGEVHGVPTSMIDHRVRARANVDRPGAWVVQVLVVDASGPRPALEALVFAAVEPSLPGTSAETASVSAEPAADLFAMLSAARRERGLPPLARDPRLDELAGRHAEEMRQRARLGHDVGAGDPAERLRAVSYPLRALGENVAHASSAVLAHRGLWTSPSHRANLLDRSFDRVGIGVSTDADGTIWVAQLFVRAR